MDPVLATALRWLLALLFAAAVVHKLADLTAFRIVLHDYEILPSALLTPATALVAATELALAATLPWPATATRAAWVALALLAVYSLGIAVNLARGRRTLECGCAPSAYRQPLSEWLLARNGVLMLVAAAVTLPREPRPLAWLDAVTFPGIMVVGITAWTAAQRLLALAPGSAPKLAPLRGES